MIATTALEALIPVVEALPAARSRVHGSEHWRRVAWAALELATASVDPTVPPNVEPTLPL